MKISTKQLKNIIAEELAEALPNIQRMTTQKDSANIKKFNFDNWLSYHKERLNKMPAEQKKQFERSVDIVQRASVQRTKEPPPAGFGALFKIAQDSLTSRASPDAEFQKVTKYITDLAKKVEPQLKAQEAAAAQTAKERGPTDNTGGWEPEQKFVGKSTPKVGSDPAGDYYSSDAGKADAKAAAPKTGGMSFASQGNIDDVPAQRERGNRNYSKFSNYSGNEDIKENKILKQIIKEELQKVLKQYKVRQ